MKVKVTLSEIVIEQDNVDIQKEDIKIEDTKVIISFAYFRELETIFEKIRKGLEDFNGDFEFRL